LCAGLLWALPVACLVPHSLPAAALWTAFATLAAAYSHWPLRRSGLCALPVLLASLSPPKLARDWPRPGPVRVTGTVAEVQHAPARGETLVRLDGGGAPRVLRVPGRRELLPGDRVAAVAHLSCPVAPDLEPTLHVPPGGLHTEPGPPSLRRLWTWLHHGLTRHLLHLVPGDAGALLATLALGRSTQAPTDLAANHRATGLSHLLAVSGAHAAMLGLLLGLPQRPRQRIGRHPLHLAMALLVLLVYAAITGGEPPVVRSAVAACLAAAATFGHRRLGSGTALATPALLTLLAAPQALTTPSFWLSYTAVFGLMLSRPVGRGWAGQWLWSPLAASAWATLITAPLTLFWFGQLAPWTVVLTPLLAPLVALLLLGSLLGATLAWLVPTLAVPFGWLLPPLAELYIGCVQWADRLPGTPIHAPIAPQPWLLAVALVFGVAALERWRHRGGIAVCAGLLTVPYFLPVQPLPPAQLTLFAIGHGQAGLYRSGAGHQVAIDCGSLHQPARATRLLVQALQHRRLDLLVVTHGDLDHHNGVPALLAQVPIARAILPAHLDGSALHAELQAAGTAIAWLQPGGQATPVPGLTVLAPPLPLAVGRNDHSLWLAVERHGTRALLCGDAQGLGIAAALAASIAAPADVLVLPHHGRFAPNVPQLLAAVRPRACFASAPSADGDTAAGRTARRAGAQLWATGQHGDLTLEFGPAPRVRSGCGSLPLPDPPR
jgi:competence protein ComEC